MAFGKIQEYIGTNVGSANCIKYAELKNKKILNTYSELKLK